MTAAAAAAAAPPLALYIHWPFCETKCPYCDFNSHVRPGIDADDWGRALLADMAHEAARLPGMRLGSVFFGGGTPSLMPPALVGALIAAAIAHWPAADDIEITLEANPSSAEAARFADLAAAGVNRLSLGLQALDDAALRLLGRPHDLAQGLAALAAAQRHFARVSVDLIHSRPGQRPTDWEAELRRALAFGTGHLSAYGLTIEEGTRFHALARQGRLDLPDADAAADMFEATAALCADAGLAAYEISNHARPGEESRHNLAYWTYAPHAGIGPGAHGRRGGMATQRLRRPEAWARQVAVLGHGIDCETPVQPAQAAREALLMGLRLADGIDPAQFAARTGVALARAVEPQARARLTAMGLLAPGPRLRTTARGRALIDRILPELVADALEPAPAIAT